MARHHIFFVLLKLLSFLTFYDTFRQATEFSPEIIRILTDRFRWALYLIVPLTMYVGHAENKFQEHNLLMRSPSWHGYATQSTLATWGIRISVTIRILLGWLEQQDMINEQLEHFGPIVIALVYSVPVYVAYIFYIIATVMSTSKIHAFLQILFWLILEGISTRPKIQKSSWNAVKLTLIKSKHLYNTSMLPRVRNFKDRCRVRRSQSTSTSATSPV